jgi:hypothetical protein
VVFLGVPEEEVANQEFTHHQLLQSYDEPLGNGNNMLPLGPVLGRSPVCWEAG